MNVSGVTLPPEWFPTSSTAPFSGMLPRFRTSPRNQIVASSHSSGSRSRSQSGSRSSRSARRRWRTLRDADPAASPAASWAAASRPRPTRPSGPPTRVRPPSGARRSRRPVPFVSACVPPPFERACSATVEGSAIVVILGRLPESPRRTRDRCRAGRPRPRRTRPPAAHVRSRVNEGRTGGRKPRPWRLSLRMDKKRATSAVDRAIGRLARQPHGIFALGDLHAAGVPSSAVTYRLEAGTLFRLHRGVYSAVPPDLLRREGRWLAAAARLRARCRAESHPRGGRLGDPATRPRARSM